MLHLRGRYHRELPPAAARPRHVGLIMDGNRRWARMAGMASPSIGHRVGAEHLGDLLGWLQARDIDHASVYVLSANNIRKRTGEELDYLFTLIETVVPQKVRASGHWQLHIAGDLDLLPVASRAALDAAVAETVHRPGHLTLAIGYDPQQEIVDAVRRLLPCGNLSADDLPDAITAALPGGPIKDIDLVIRTSGERRISGFFPWQSGRAEIHFSDKMWPAFTEHDLDLALADYARRKEDP
ncbi:di-trans,poly-cis-decaprenylcistransferase [Flexivirga sp. ID2601S]|uniref:Di-trans,poly-cis-decaprenylcistransferase n=1 Tax=Flexivirga aerilata TaxID=1656889 RepID=A0A849AGQ0_9MICO|nr:polyprenyl diphosphate synthase [Flexivirga aerilata]NNG38736.1 di-trans,poly-cis-decaprenylcistransferase [Flexivirga aerilata]